MAAPTSLRLVFEYEDYDIRLVGIQVVHMKSPRPHPAPPSRARAGFWYELQDAEGRVLYHRRARHPVVWAAEVYTEDHDRPYRRVPLAEKRGNFTLVVPDDPRGHSVELFGTTADREGWRGDPARSLGTFDLSSVQREDLR